MDKIRVGVTGGEGFLGGALLRHLATRDGFEVVKFERGWFGDASALSGFLGRCDAVVHFAGLSRHEDGEYLYRVNLDLARALHDALMSLKRKPAVFFASTTHIDRDLPYHASKRDAEKLLGESGAEVITLLMPNAFGPGSRPFYNSVVSTFCALAAAGKQPERIDDVTLRLIYVDELCEAIIDELGRTGGATRRVTIAHTAEIALPLLWRVVSGDHAAIPDSPLRRQLIATAASYRG